MVAVCFQQVLGQSLGLLAEDKVYLAVVGNVGILFLRLGGEIPKYSFVGSKKLIYVFVIFYIQKLPVIKPRAL